MDRFRGISAMAYHGHARAQPYGSRHRRRREHAAAQLVAVTVAATDTAMITEGSVDAFDGFDGSWCFHAGQNRKKHTVKSDFLGLRRQTPPGHGHHDGFDGRDDANSRRRF